jgi:hypothetical protein
MKKLLFLAAAGLVTAMFFSSCSKDETVAAPTVTITGVNVTITNDTLKLTAVDGKAPFGVTIDIKADGEIKAASLTKAAGTSSSTVAAFTKAATDAVGKTTMSYSLKDTLAAGKTTYTISVTDKKDQTVSQSLIVVVAAPAPVTTPMTIEKTDGQLWNQNSPGIAAWDIVGDVPVSAGDPSTTKDMANVTATSPGAIAAYFEAKNSTMFVKANSFDYANATVEAATAAYAAGTPAMSASGVANNDIYIAKLRGGSDYAVIKITLVDPSSTVKSATNTGVINFSYKLK